MIRIEEEAVITQDRIHWRHFIGKFIFSKVQSRNFQDTLSKALWKSILRSEVGVFFLLQVSISSSAISALSKIYRPSMKADCAGPTSVFITFWRRFVRILATILYRQPTILMGRKSLKSDGLSTLGIKAMYAMLQP